jgi:hypothetical protein
MLYKPSILKLIRNSFMNQVTIYMYTGYLETLRRACALNTPRLPEVFAASKQAN